MTFYICFGKYAGWHFFRDNGYRLVLGWVSVAAVFADLEVVVGEVKRALWDILYADKDNHIPNDLFWRAQRLIRGWDAAPLGGMMIVTISWYADGSGKPIVRFQDVKLLAANNVRAVIGPLVDDIRETADKECYVYEVTDENFELIYDSTMPEEERRP